IKKITPGSVRHRRSRTVRGVFRDDDARTGDRDRRRISVAHRSGSTMPPKWFAVRMMKLTKIKLLQKIKIYKAFSFGLPRPQGNAPAFHAESLRIITSCLSQV